MIKIVVTDLDNTLYNWVDYYVPAFRAMVTELVKISGVERQALNASFKRLHQRYRTSEYTFAVQQLDVLREIDAGLTVPEVLVKYNSAIRAFRVVRKEKLKLYEGVTDTLTSLRASGKKLVASTEAMFYYARYRLKQLGVEGLYDGLVATEEHGFPEGTLPEHVRISKDPSMYETKVPYWAVLKSGDSKPSPAFLQDVLTAFGCKPHEAIYVGDSLYKDVYMAKQCGVHDVWAEYGRHVDLDNYRELVEITHWTDEDVATEMQARQLRIVPSYTLKSFAELIQVVKLLDE